MTRLEHERRRRGWNQTVLAFHAGITQGEVSKIENRRLVPTENCLRRLSHAVGVPADDLLKEASAEDLAHAI